jgi:hypothetical protein
MLSLFIKLLFSTLGCVFQIIQIRKSNKAEVYLGSMESKHTTRFERKKRAQK